MEKSKEEGERRVAEIRKEIEEKKLKDLRKAESYQQEFPRVNESNFPDDFPQYSVLQGN
jgi:hypothetical protein